MKAHMTQHAWLRILPVLILLVGACSASNPFIVSDKTKLAPVGEAKFSPHSDKVFFTKQSPPSTVKFDLISTIVVGSAWYGSENRVYKSMAERARLLGANAVFEVKTWRQPSGISSTAPHGSGQAVHVDDMRQLEALNLQGSWH